MKHQQHSLFVDLAAYQLHVRQLTPVQSSVGPILYLHGAVENGRIFYSHSGKGLACFLADHGFMGYAVDFAGRGLSQPSLQQGLQQSQQQLICHDIPALIEYFYELHQQPLTLICHSWGGVLAAACLARFPHLLPKIKAKICFGTKRVISVRSLARTVKIDLIWNKFAPWLGQRYGYLPAKRWRLGADNEPLQFLRDTIPWIKGAPFTDLTDQFDYQGACQRTSWPAIWHFAGAFDRLLGHPQDVQAFMTECHQHDAQFSVLGKAFGNAANYDHISMLTHPAATTEHFAALAQWLKALYARSTLRETSDL